MLRANLICMASMLIWAMAFPAVDLLVPILPTVTLTALRFLLAIAFLLPLWLVLEGPAALARARWGRGLVVGAIGFGIGATMLVTGQVLSDGVTVAVIAATTPIIGLTFEVVQDGRRLRPELVLGILLSIAGGILAYAARLGGFGLGLGALAALVSCIAFTWGSRRTVRDLPGTSALGQTTVTLCGAAIATTVLSLATGLGGADLGALGAREWGALVIYGIGTLAISQVLWIIGVTHLGVGIAAMHINIAPFYVMVFAWSLGGGWNWLQALGAGIVAAGVLLGQARIRRAPQPLHPDAAP